MLLKLPKWVLTNKFPAVNDCESLTVIEQTARIYGKVNELIESYNKYVENINKTISDFQVAKTEEVETFLHNLEILTNDYINTVDMKTAHQDRAIAEVYQKFSEDVLTTLKLKISEFKANGELDNAILETLDNVNEKINQFVLDCEEFKAEITADYNALKSDLRTDYEGKKTALDKEYTDIKAELVKEHENTKSRLETEYNEVKANLENDYNTYKNNILLRHDNTIRSLQSDLGSYQSSLQIDYNETKSALNSDYEGKKAELEQRVETAEQVYSENNEALNQAYGPYKSMVDNKNTILYDGEMASGDLTEPLLIENLGNFYIFKVRIGVALCVCSIRYGVDSDDFVIVGTGNSVSSIGSSTDAIFLGCVQLRGTRTNGEHKITKNSSHIVNLKAVQNGVVGNAVEIGAQPVFEIIGVI